MIKYKDFRIGDIFEKLSAPYLGEGIKAKNVRKIKSNEFCIPVVYAKCGDNGIMYWARKNDFKTYKNVISIIYNGAVAAGLVYAQEEETGILAESYFIKFKGQEVSFKANLYFKTVIEKVIYPKYSRDELATWTGKVENDIISLPVNNNEEIDLNYINDYITGLEREYLTNLQKERDLKLKKSLLAAGINDCKITKEEKEILNKNVKFKQFKIEELFDIHPTKSYKLSNQVLFKGDGNTPVITNTSINNGVTDYTSLEPTEKGNIITFSDTTTGDAIFYQPQDFVGYSHIQGMYPKVYIKKWNEKSLLYFIILLKKQTSGIFDYATKLNRIVVSNFIIELPVDDSNNIHFDYMEKYIRAIEKLTIKDVIEYKDKVIKTTKQICNI